MNSIKNINNIGFVLLKAVECLGVPIKTSMILDELKKHPDQQSLLAISDILTFFRIKNSAYQLPVEDLYRVPVPFIASTIINGSDFIVVTKTSLQEITFSKNFNRSETVDTKSFAKLYRGISLVIQAYPNTVQNSLNRTLLFDILSKIKLSLLSASFCLILGTVIYNCLPVLAKNPYLGILLLLKTIGLSLSVLLLLNTFNDDSPLLQKLCQNGNTINCNSILKSDAANAFWGFSWSEIGFFYFSGTWAVLAFYNAHPFSLLCLLILNICCLPYTLFSFYYQAIVAKQWCLLCTSVQLVLWAEFIITIQFNGTYISPSVTELLNISVFLIAPIIGYMWIKPLIISHLKVDFVMEQLRKFKYSTYLFNALLNLQPKYAIPGADCSIPLGDQNANNVLVIVSGPYCQPCARAHAHLEDIMHFRKDVQVRFIFRTTDNLDDDQGRFSKHAYQLSRSGDIKEALNNWYSSKKKNFL